MKICVYCEQEVQEYKGYYWCKNCEEYVITEDDYEDENE